MTNFISLKRFEIKKYANLIDLLIEISFWSRVTMNQRLVIRNTASVILYDYFLIFQSLERAYDVFQTHDDFWPTQ